MSDAVLVVWDDVLTSYDHGPGHPLRPLRLDLTIALARDLGVLSAPHLTVAPPVSASDELIRLVHDPDYVGAVRAAPDARYRRLSARYGLGDGDNPVFARMHESAALVTGASVQAAAAVWAGNAQHAVNIAGGLHHAMRGRASGFCVYDDPAVAIAWLLSAGAERVAYVDIDVHHGDGVQAAFYTDPRVLTVSLHESGHYLFPGTGFAKEIGRDAGIGTSVNVALPPATTDAGWLRAFSAVVPPLLRAFRPQVLVTQLGCDTHVLDPLAHLELSVDGQRASYRRLHALAHELCGGRWIVLGGGGYQGVQVVPRAWTAAIAEAADVPLPATTPVRWRDYVAERTGEVAPTQLSDGRRAEYLAFDGGDGPPTDQLDAAIIATRSAVFGHHGLDPAMPDTGAAA